MEHAPVVYNYSDCRAFFTAWLVYLKQQTSSYSLREMAREAGISPTLLSLYFSGRRNLTAGVMRKLARPLQLEYSQLRYLELVRRLSESDSQEVRVAALKKIQLFRKKHRLSSEGLEGYRLLAKWYYPVFRAMATMEEFKLDYAWIRKQLRKKIPIPEIKDAIEFMLRDGYLETLPNGNIRITKEFIIGSGGAYRVALSEYHREMFKHASDAITEVPSTHRKMLGHTFAIPQDAFQKVSELLDRTARELFTISQETDPDLTGKPRDSIYYVSLAAFPLTRVKSGKKENP